MVPVAHSHSQQYLCPPGREIRDLVDDIKGEFEGLESPVSTSAFNQQLCTMATTTSNAIFMDGNGRFSLRQIDVDEKYSPKGSQTLVEVAYSAINPADIRHYHMGETNCVAGSEWAGIAIEVGPASPFKVGQQLLGLAMTEDQRPLPAGSHQGYLLAEPEWTFPAPAGLDLLHAVGFPAAVQTSIDALFNQLGFALPAAGVPGAYAANEAILIWGGGSGCGQAGIQLAKAAGFSPIITTASPRNHDLLKQLGATHCFDYRSQDVIKQIRSCLAGKKLQVAYDAVAVGLGCFEGLSAEEEAAVMAKFEESSPALVRQCCDDGEELKLCAVLPVPEEKSAGWKFPMPFRLPEGAEIPRPRGFEGFFEGINENPEWGSRMKAVRDWLLADGAKRWTPFNTRVIKGGEEAIEAIHEVFAGKAGGQKVVIAHPMVMAHAS